MNHIPASPLSVLTAFFIPLVIGAGQPLSVQAADVSPQPGAAQAPPAEELHIEVMKKGLGKEVTIRRGAKEWFMLVEVTPDNTVVIRQEKEQESYLVDESETHDRALTSGEVDVVIEDFINSVKTRSKTK